MVSDKKNDLLLSLALMVTGILFVTLKGEFISIAMTIIGASLILVSVINLFIGNLYEALAEAVVGVFVIVFGWLLVTVAIYVFAVALIAYGVLKIRMAFVLFGLKAGGATALLAVISGVMNIALGILLFFNRGGTVDWIFIVSGAVLIAEGFLGFVDVIVSERKKRKAEGKSVKTKDGSEFHY